MASREELLTPRRNEEVVFVRTLGVSVRMRSLSRKARDELERQAKVDGRYSQGRHELLILAHCIVDPDLSVSDVEALEEQDTAILDELSLHLNALNFRGKGEELKKASSPIPSSGSVFASPNGSGAPSESSTTD